MVKEMFQIPFKNRILSESVISWVSVHNEEINQGQYNSVECRHSEDVSESKIIEEE